MPGKPARSRHAPRKRRVVTPKAKRVVEKSADLLLQKERLPPAVKNAPVPTKPARGRRPPLSRG